MAFRRMRRSRAVWSLLVVAALVCGWTLVSVSDVYNNSLSDAPVHNAWEDSDEPDADLDGTLANWRGLTDEQIGQMSELGRLLFVDPSLRPPPRPRNFTILVWRHGKLLERRHLRRFGDRKLSPWEGCAVSNCRLTYADVDLVAADAVVFHLHRTESPAALPARGPQHAHQRWVFLTDESPLHTFLKARKGTKLADFDGLFNWSMTYRMDSDVPVPYGRTLALPADGGRGWQPPEPRTRLAVIMGSNCARSGNHRWDYVRRLQQLLPGQVDVYGRCGTLTCPGHFTKDCPALSQYKFYLSFENSNCREYVTEKLWWNAYHHGAVPVVMGASQQDCQRLLPPGSYLHAADFASLADLARYLQHLDRSPRDYAAFFRWRRRFRVLNEHGYFGAPTRHYCRLCEALNYNERTPKVYSRLGDFWNAGRDCYPPYYT
ncbi:alpha-(1,3)-fucosyltransferase 7-like isoform X1 [Schistocerca americana]|uniref:alpha-(1,3)-fucosyltransferase 7-like isoform X1 n=2 Tax=Schistocerca americana TaxID=7009 RepID=UPI001F4FD3CE|nr:alpha-(1,3)-fucosyltransferase 7-like isoform X1 [Schistocerca americana]